MTNNDFVSSHKVGTRALIIGSGMAGLFAAQTLSQYYDQVQIIERDILPEEPQERPGTPQSFHLHRMVGRGREIIGRMFPGIIAELLERGAVSSPSRKVLVESPYGEYEIYPPVEEASCSRALLEWTIRQRVQAISNVQFSTALEVTGLQLNPERTHITGVQARSRYQAEQSSVHLTADLVVDASGIYSKITPWLQELGYTVPEPERVNTALEYSSRHYKVTPQSAKEKMGIVINGEPEKKIGTIYALQVENNQWYVILYGAGGNYPPTDDKGFEQHIRQMPNAKLADTLQAEAEPTTSPRGFRIMVCRRQHFEQMADWPAGMLVIGDALCNLDPIYGHGMAVSALEAEILDNCFSQQKEDPQPDFERRALASMQDAIQPAWWIGAITDLRWSGVTYTGQEPPQAVALLNRYLDLYYQEATKRLIEELSHASEAPASEAPAPPNPFSTEPSVVSYIFFTFDLTISPTVIFNPITYRLLLEIEAAQEGPHLLQSLTDEYNLSLEEILNKSLPTFDLPFMAPPTEATVE